MDGVVDGVVDEVVMIWFGSEESWLLLYVSDE